MNEKPVFEVGFTKSDAIRSAWGFVMPFVTVFIVSTLGLLNTFVASCNDKCDWSMVKTGGIAAVIALISAILVGLKNLLLADGSTIKG